MKKLDFRRAGWFLEHQDRHGARHAVLHVPGAAVGQTAEGRSNLFSIAVIVSKALANDPAQRWQDGEMMAKALWLCLQSLSALKAAAAASAAPAAWATSA
jgi:hypothetical protein